MSVLSITALLFCGAYAAISISTAYEIHQDGDELPWMGILVDLIVLILAVKGSLSL